MPQREIALGESQSAFRLVTYINAVQPLSPGVYDAYFVYSRGGDAADLSQSPQLTIPTPTPTFIRNDLHVPIFLFETESDLLGLGYLAARQPATAYVREWGDGGHGPRRHLRPALQPIRHRKRGGRHLGVQLHPQPAEGPHPRHRRLRGADQRRLAHLRAAGGGAGGQHVGHYRAGPPAIAAPRSEPGGSRTPSSTMPTAMRSAGSGRRRSPHPSPSSRAWASPARGRCTLVRERTRSPSRARPCAGSSVPRCRSARPEACPAALYPTHAAFVQKWDAATAAEVKEGYLLPADAQILDQVAAQSSVGG